MNKATVSITILVLFAVISLVSLVNKDSGVNEQPGQSSVAERVSRTKCEAESARATTSTGESNHEALSGEDDTSLRASRKVLSPREHDPRILEQAALEFEKNLELRESSYGEVIPLQGMISVEEAYGIAKQANRAVYDPIQKPKIVLTNAVYEVVFWKCRQPHLSQTGPAATILIDAWSGNVEEIIVSN